MQVILLQDIENLGTAGDIVDVKPGYARNYLVPRGLALRASKRNLAVSEEKKRVVRARQERERKALLDLAEKLNKIELTIEVKVGDEERMFGSVSTQDIHRALEEKGISVDRHAIRLEEPIKSLGIYNIPIKLALDLEPKVKIYVIKA
jgi:large subunit ribosomal protein L9